MIDHSKFMAEQAKHTPCNQRTARMKVLGSSVVLVNVHQSLICHALAQVKSMCVLWRGKPTTQVFVESAQIYELKY